MLAGITLAAISLLVYFGQTYFKNPSGVQNTGVWLRQSTARSPIVWIIAVVLTGFYVILYGWPYLFTGPIRSLDGVSQARSGKPADHWFL
ncbi:MAG: hypothetical protein AVDCRST_MAG95-3887 [uncultured Adhaeribacter sp.]|uniref:Uncharacterized protein n=1 Tax=uncultured Adhaeribacter sp. TaxID=448109 RepID=A0A6J4JWL4_9BACT|nr:MAG: hypothetical protein AVDCRST_MAG95-3887 [uncultured Adhaeribacter sp.]